MPWLVLWVLGCSAPPPDAGSPEALAPFLGSDAMFSDLSDAGYDAVPGQYVVLVDRDAPDDRLDLVRRVVPGADVVAHLDVLPILTVRMTPEDAARLADDPDVVAVEPDALVWASRGPGKPGTGACASSSSQTVPAGIAALGTNSGGGAGVRVAVLDTGIDAKHPDLAVAGLVDETGVGSGADDNGHGTHVSGTIAALNNRVGVVGVAPGVSLYGVKVLDRRGAGSYSTIAAGIDWAIANGMDVTNMSFGGTSDGVVLHDAITAAYDAGLVQVTAAGNSGADASTAFPAAYDGEVLTISAYDVATSSWPYWTNWGVPPVDVAGPGVNVCSTTYDGAYGLMSGTSMAAPHVTGAVAVYLGNHPGASFEAVSSALVSGARPLANTALHPEDLANISTF